MTKQKDKQYPQQIIQSLAQIIELYKKINQTKTIQNKQKYLLACEKISNDLAQIKYKLCAPCKYDLAETFDIDYLNTHAANILWQFIIIANVIPEDKISAEHAQFCIDKYTKIKDNSINLLKILLTIGLKTNIKINIANKNYTPAEIVAALKIENLFTMLAPQDNEFAQTTDVYKKIDSLQQNDYKDIENHIKQTLGISIGQSIQLINNTNQQILTNCYQYIFETKQIGFSNPTTIHFLYYNNANLKSFKKCILQLGYHPKTIAEILYQETKSKHTIQRHKSSRYLIKDEPSLNQTTILFIDGLTINQHCEDNIIQKILQKYLNENIGKKLNIRLLYLCGEAYGMHLDDNATEDEVRLAIKNKKQTNADHLTLNEITIDTVNKKIQLQTYNPFGNGSPTPNQQKFVQNKIAPITGITDITVIKNNPKDKPQRQHDAHSCGPITTNDIICLLEHKPLEKQPPHAEKLRLQQLNQLHIEHFKSFILFEDKNIDHNTNNNINDNNHINDNATNNKCSDITPKQNIGPTLIPTPKLPSTQIPTLISTRTLPSEKTPTPNLKTNTIFLVKQNPKTQQRQQEQPETKTIIKQHNNFLTTIKNAIANVCKFLLHFLTFFIFYNTENKPTTPTKERQQNKQLHEVQTEKIIENNTKISI